MGYELLFLGLLLALGFIALTGYYPGGMIVPGYLVLFVNHPYRMAGTLAAALITWALYALASRYLLLFGRRRFVFLILCGAVCSLIVSQIVPSIFPGSIDYRVIGLVIPGLIAGNFERQGIAITTASMAIVIAATWFAWNLWFLIT
ncbi:MAG: poly-gamma-glutamate biosynthesis protein PgsC [Bacteroidales bacterium]|jgi:poly-gamma-glutamate biosynthesis protein PgsC/CapC|nr:poly-gamma-glutamate biosynthesis protein PgsC [Bacteroidales bacterium]